MDAVAYAALKSTLALIEQNDTNYAIRYGLVLRALSLAVQCGYAAGIALDSNDPDWPVAYIELPSGQVSWHMPKHSVEYDGHSTEEKYTRIRMFTSVGGGV